MPMEPWYKIATPRKEVREGRSFNPDEFAIHLEQVIAGTAPDDYRDPNQFFRRTCFTRALREHAGMVLRRLSGETANTAPVMTLITQFGGGKTHTLAALYHLVKNGRDASEYPGVSSLLKEAGLKTVPKARVAAFVGNAWDPGVRRETPWIDIAWQLAGEEGVRQLGPAAKSSPPGTEALERVFLAAGAPDAALQPINLSIGEPKHPTPELVRQALIAGPNGAAFHREIIREGANRLNAAGWICLEIGEEQKGLVDALVREAGSYDIVCFRQDYGGKERVAAARKKTR